MKPRTSEPIDLTAKQIIDNAGKWSWPVVFGALGCFTGIVIILGIILMGLGIWTGN